MDKWMNEWMNSVFQNVQKKGKPTGWGILVPVEYFSPYWRELTRVTEDYPGCMPSLLCTKSIPG